MNADFCVRADPKRALLVIELSGFFQVSDVLRFSEETSGVRERFSRAPSHHVTLVDVSTCRIQSQDVYEAFIGLAPDPMSKARKLAFVTGDTLVKLQVSRLIKSRANARSFSDKMSAEAWLFANDDEEDQVRAG